MTAGWADPERAVKSFIDGALDGQADGPAYAALAAQRGVQTDEIVDRSYELLRDAEAEFFSTRRLGRALIPRSVGPLPR